jgi:hypothetical protein
MYLPTIVDIYDCMAKNKPNKEQLQESYSRLKSIRKVGEEFGYTGEGIRVLMHLYNLDIKTPSKDLYTCDDDFFSRDNEGSFYVAGYLAADGCVKARKGKENPSVVALAIGVKDEIILNEIRQLMKVENPISKKLVKNSLTNPNWKDSEEVELTFTSHKMCNDLKRFNIVQRKSLIYSFPEWLINHPLVNHFMRGYNDGDGSFFLNKGVNVSQVYFGLRGTQPFLHIYRSILERECKLEPRIKTIRVNTGIGVLEYGGNGIVGKIAKFLYKDASIMLDRKYQIVKDLLSIEEQLEIYVKKHGSLESYLKTIDCGIKIGKK